MTEKTPGHRVDWHLNQLRQAQEHWISEPGSESSWAIADLRGDLLYILDDIEELADSFGPQ